MRGAYFAVMFRNCNSIGEVATSYILDPTNTESQRHMNGVLSQDTCLVVPCVFFFVSLE